MRKIKRGQMGAYLCIASNDVPPAVSKRIILNVNCEHDNDLCTFICLFETKALARQSKFALCCNVLSLASPRFLEHLKTPTDGTLSTKCWPSPHH